MSYHFDKPKHMKRETYYAKQHEIIRLEEAYLGAVMVQIERLRKTVGITAMTR